MSALSDKLESLGLGTRTIPKAEAALLNSNKGPTDIPDPVRAAPIADILSQIVTGKDRAEVKGCAWADVGAKSKTTVGDYDIQIVSSTPIDGGVEVLARAWHAGGDQIGFGTDGTVDIERFRVFNPPILVEDSEGDIVQEFEDVNGNPMSRTLREDAEAAMLQSLAHTVKVIAKFGPDAIVSGKVGSTTSTFYPQAGSGGGNVTCDGVATIGYVATWALARDAATAGGVNNSTAQAAQARALHNASGYYMNRSGFTFDTSSIPDGDAISSAVFSLYGQGNAAVNGSTSDNDVVSFAPANANDIVVGDWDAFGTTVYASQALSSWNPNAYNDFTLDAAGRSYISKTAPTSFGLRNSRDTDDSEPALNEDNYSEAYYADQTGTTNDPKLVVEHAATTTIGKVDGVAYAAIAKIIGVAKASVGKLFGIQ